MSTKPIFIVELNCEATDEDLVSAHESLSHFAEDYYVVILKGNTDDIKFNAFYEKDFNEVKYEELKQIVKDISKK